MDEAEVALLNEIEKRQSGPLVALRDRDDQSEVGLDEGAVSLMATPDRAAKGSSLSLRQRRLASLELLLCGYSVLDPPRQGLFIALGEQDELTGLMEVEVDEVVGVTDTRPLAARHETFRL
ncbi:MAG TPA: hypothetical protein VG869_03240 [Acidimicrobiia bacterium]|nr:hypothetical protein [Acidimicrobiia bacterium]